MNIVPSEFLLLVSCPIEVFVSITKFVDFPRLQLSAPCGGQIKD
jgi:hypothetical protein